MFCVTRGPPSIAAQFLRMHHENRHRQGSVADLQSASCLCCPALLRISALHRHAARDPGTLQAFRPGKGPAGCHDSALWHGRDSLAGTAQRALAGPGPARFALTRMAAAGIVGTGSDGVSAVPVVAVKQTLTGREAGPGSGPGRPAHRDLSCVGRSCHSSPAAEADPAGPGTSCWRRTRAGLAGPPQRRRRCAACVGIRLSLPSPPGWFTETAKRVSGNQSASLGTN